MPEYIKKFCKSIQNDTQPCRSRTCRLLVPDHPILPDFVTPELDSASLTSAGPRALCQSLPLGGAGGASGMEEGRLFPPGVSCAVGERSSAGQRLPTAPACGHSLLRPSKLHLHLRGAWHHLRDLTLASFAGKGLFLSCRFFPSCLSLGPGVVASWGCR